MSTTRENNQNTIMRKNRMFGDCISTNELLNALKNECYKDSDEAVLIHAPSSKSKYGEPLIYIFECIACNKLHLLAGIPIADFPKSLAKDMSKSLEAKLSKVYFDYLVEDKNFVSRKKLISILQNIPINLQITIGVIYKSENMYTLTEVIKCSDDCFCVHLNCAYDKDCILRN
jgi:hypothetical protein